MKPSPRIYRSLEAMDFGDREREKLIQ